MLQSELCSIVRPDVDQRRRTVTVRDRKDPRHKDGNDQRVALVDLTGYVAWDVLAKQRRSRMNKGRILPLQSPLNRERFPPGLRGTWD